MTRVARRVLIRGVVQGVGFRPLVFRAAAKFDIRGWVCNGAAGVEIHAEGRQADLEAFLQRLRERPPPAARIAEFVVKSTLCRDYPNFQILASQAGADPSVRISPDLAVCEHCLQELRDPGNRRFGYPYINCTNCGPRYSIIRGLPYDRARTTLADWTLCAQCRQEYSDPLDRRYHAQPIGCFDCGPTYELLVGAQRIGDVAAALKRTAELLNAGAIVAIKGIGGYHLACDARNASAVNSLRTRKFRKEKPFAVMVRTLDEARRIAALTPAHMALLGGVGRPIVLAPRQFDLPGVAPDSDHFGVMLPYTPLHELLFDAGAPTASVLTSANRSNEPIAYRDDDARQRLAGIADAFLIGQRPIARRVDDAVATVRLGKPLAVRRGRGDAPGAVCQLPTEQSILALGSDLKNSLALVVRGQVFVSQQIGDLDDAEAETAFKETVDDLLAMYELRPERLVIAHDLHPQFRSTRFALSLPCTARVAVQHHEAHLASVLAEHGLFEQTVVGVAFDGTGYGRDGAIWGGEFFVGGLPSGFQRAAWLRPVLIPGGDAAARFPVQAAAGYLADCTDLPDLHAAPFDFPPRFAAALSMVRREVRCFRTTSMGRLFDAVAALLGFTREVSFEGQAAIWLESQARKSAPQQPYPLENLDHRPLLQAVIRDRLNGRPIAEIAAAVHAGIGRATAATAQKLCTQRRLKQVVLSGGVFQNEILFADVHRQLTERGLQVLSNSVVPVNDGGISLGQAAMAGCTPSALP